MHLATIYTQRIFPEKKICFSIKTITKDLESMTTQVEWQIPLWAMLNIFISLIFGRKKAKCVEWGTFKNTLPFSAKW